MDFCYIIFLVIRMHRENQPNAVDIGAFLKATREDLDMSQIKVMELTGINNKTLSGYENGVSQPDIQTFVILAKLYGFSIDKLFGLNNFE